MKHKNFLILKILILIFCLNCSPSDQVVTQENEVISAGAINFSEASSPINTPINTPTTVNEEETQALPTGLPKTETETKTDTLTEIDTNITLNLRISKKDSNQITCHPLHNDVNDNHDRINCGALHKQCHSTYFAGTPINLTAPLNAVCTGNGAFRGILAGFECNGKFVKLTLPARTFIFNIKEDMECIAIYTNTMKR